MKDFFKHVSFASEKTKPCFYNSKSLFKDKTCSKKTHRSKMHRSNPKCINLFITNSIRSFQKITAVANGISDFYKMILTVYETSFQKSKCKEILYRSYKNFEINKFKNVLRPPIC